MTLGTWSRRLLLWTGSLVALLATAALLRAVGAPTLLVRTLHGVLLLLLAWGALAGAAALLRPLFWSVGRRLFLSYILIGFLPLLLALTLAGLCGYVASGLVLAHLAEDARRELAAELEARTAHADLSRPGSEDPEPLFARYERGRRISGSERLPELWPPLQSDAGAGPSGSTLVLLEDETLALAAWSCRSDRCALAAVGDTLSSELRRRAGVWIDLLLPDDPRRRSAVRVQVGPYLFVLRGLRFQMSSAEELEFQRISPPASQPPGFLDRPWLLWSDEVESVLHLGTGESLPGGLSVAYAASPRGLLRGLRAGTSRGDARLWLALAALGIVFAEIAVAATLLAASMIVGLSRAVNRLSAATVAIARGDFSVRIASKRRDQLGALHRSFNFMAEQLQELVRTRAEKEALDRELALAREVQQNLLPSRIEVPTGYEIETRFEPSAALGGDCFDLRLLPDGRLSILVADVSGHGLAAGLRMALVRAAFGILLEEGYTPEQVLARIDRDLRLRGSTRAFVTAVIALLEPDSGTVTVVSAGHPPVYVLHSEGSLDELVLQSAPLGALRFRLASTAIELAPGESLVLLTDGWIECTDPAGQPFGYERLAASLRGAPLPCRTVAGRLDEAVRRHCLGKPREDDSTLVVLGRSAGATRALKSEAIRST